MCGMNSDRVAESTGKRGLEGQGSGLVIINLQKTQYDNITSVRIFSTLDKVMPMILEELGLSLPKKLVVFDEIEKW